MFEFKVCRSVCHKFTPFRRLWVVNYGMAQELQCQTVHLFNAETGYVGNCRSIHTICLIPTSAPLLLTVAKIAILKATTPALMMKLSATIVIFHENDTDGKPRSA